MSDLKKVLILDSTSVRGAFHDRGDVVEVSPQVAQDLINERKGTTNERAIAAREAEIVKPSQADIDADNFEAGAEYGRTGGKLPQDAPVAAQKGFEVGRAEFLARQPVETPVTAPLNEASEAPPATEQASAAPKAEKKNRAPKAEK